MYKKLLYVLQFFPFFIIQQILLNREANYILLFFCSTYKIFLPNGTNGTNFFLLFSSFSSFIKIGTNFLHPCHLIYIERTTTIILPYVYTFLINSILHLLEPYKGISNYNAHKMRCGLL